jgi:ribose transport system substrate-binding protein
VLAAIGVAVLVSACGSSSSSGSASTSAETSPSSEAGETGGGTDLAAFEKIVTEAQSPKETWEGPTTSPPVAKDKTIAAITCSPDSEGCQRDVNGAVEAAEAIGWKAQKIETSGTPQEFNTAIEHAINSGADGIVAASFSEEVIDQALEAAKAKDIPVVDMVAGNEQPKITSDFAGGLYAEVDMDPVEQGEIAAAWMIDQTKGKAIAGTLVAPEFPSQVQRQEGFKKIFGECEECELKQEIKQPVAELAKEGSSVYTSFLQANPEANFFFPNYDGAAVFAVQGVHEAGKDGSVSIVSTDGNKPNMQFISEGNVQTGSVAEPMEWIGWASVDQLNRAFNDEEPAPEWAPGGGGIPSKLITKSNVPPEGKSWDGDFDYKPEFEKLWGSK